MQTTLFDNPRLPFRTTDPESSRIAAREIVASGAQAAQRMIALAVLVKHGPGTSRELAQRSGKDRFMLARRLPELATLGLARRGPVRPCTAGGKPGVEWRETGKE